MNFKITSITERITEDGRKTLEVALKSDRALPCYANLSVQDSEEFGGLTLGGTLIITRAANAVPIFKYGYDKPDTKKRK